jgi:hypothetical protein
VISLTNYKSTKVRTLKGRGIFIRIKEVFQSAAIFGTNPVTALVLYSWYFVKNGVKDSVKTFFGKKPVTVLINKLSKIDIRVEALESRVEMLESRNITIHGQKPLIIGFTGPPPGTFDGTTDHIDLPDNTPKPGSFLFDIKKTPLRDTE